MRPLIRFLGSVLSVSGTLLLADAALTVLWQEPVSALIAQRTQSQLEEQLEDRFARLRRESRALTRVTPPRRRPERLARNYATTMRRGHGIGFIDFPKLRRRYAFVEGTDAASLRKGPGHYPATGLPGEGRSVAIAGHRTTYLAPFRTIDRLRRGDQIVLEMPYGRFTYAVEGTQIVRPDAVWVTRDVRYERLVLTACHPLYSASRRIVVFAKLARAAVS